MARIAVIGAGNIGGTLGDVWRRAGHEVTFGVRDPGERSEDGRVFATPEDAIRDAAVVVFAVPGAAMDETVATLQRLLEGKVIIDATNRIGAPTPHSTALKERTTDATPVYRAFNSLGWENFRDPHYGDDVADLFYAGPEGPGRAVVEGLISDVGLRPIYVGTDADLVDSVLRLWFALVRGQNMGRGLAFKVLQR
jgi:8-hydroxy-5-deazaflavin:NADPH oxidoreductase